MKNRFKNLYHIFDVSDFFDNSKEIRRMYRILGSRWHPSRNVNMSKIAENRFKDLSRAFQILSNDEKRKAYDKLLKEAENDSKFNEVLQPFFENREFSHYDDFFKKMIAEENKTFNDDFFKETDLEFKALVDKNQEKDKVELNKSSKTNTFIKDNKRYTQTTNSWEDQDGNKTVETIEDYGNRVVKKHIEKLFHDEEGNLLKEIQEDSGNGLQLIEKKLLALADGNIIPSKNSK